MKASTMVLSLDDIRAAIVRVKPHVHRTPLVTSATLDKLSERRLFFKCENLQKTGSFKARGATNGIFSRLEKDPSLPGVVTHSSGNAGQAVAWAAQRAGLPCTIVVPKGTPEVKASAIRGYGSDLVYCESSPTSRKETCARIAAEQKREIIHPYDDYAVMAGQGTLVLEMMEQLKEMNVESLDAILVAVSGGGLAAGVATAAKALNPNCKVIGVEAKGKELEPCLKAKQRLWTNPPQFIDTIAEGIKTQQCGQLTFPILCELLEKKVISVTDDEMRAALHLIAERMKLVVEAAGAAVVAAAIYKQEVLEKHWPDQLKRVGLVICGGNTDLAIYASK